MYVRFSSHESSQEFTEVENPHFSCLLVFEYSGAGRSPAERERRFLIGRWGVPFSVHSLI